MRNNPTIKKLSLLIFICAIVYGFLCIAKNADFVNEVKESVDHSEMIDIGGIKQYIQINGDDIENPLILFLHGGPGFAQSSFINHYQDSLKEHFVVVNWDQRGAGKSYSDDIPKETMSVEQFVSDTDELVDYLMEKYDKRKIYLAGHSWGSILGLMETEHYPDKFYAYIGIGQVIDSEQGEKISYEFIQDEARNANNTEAMKAIVSIGYPPYNDLRDLSIERKWVTYFGGSFREINVYTAMEESLKEEAYQQHKKGTVFSVVNLLPEIMEINFFDTIKSVKIPVYFCMGRYDYHTPSRLVEQYIKGLEAPKKKLVWFEESAHHPNVEESDKFNDVLIMIKDETYDH
jgi:pimeloyl-ACP methyl ester carboxylesterase